MRPLSFRLRIALSSAAISGAVLIGFGFAGYLLMGRERLASVDLEVQAAEQRLRVESVVAPDVWVEVDWSLLRQALMNLLQNSLRHNQPDGWIRVTLSAQDQSIQFRVCNSGPCIPAEDQARLFDRFFRVDAARHREMQGAGLGLSLAREIARAHHGSLVLEESQSGRTCFCLSLPASGSDR